MSGGKNALRNSPRELPIFSLITWMQGAVAGLKCVKKIKKYIYARTSPQGCGKTLLNLGGTLREGGDGGVILGRGSILSEGT